VRVAGEALVLTVEIEGASRAADADGKLEILKELRPEIEAETNKINGPGRGQVGVHYRVDRFEEDKSGASDRAVSLTITIYGLVTTDQRSYRLRRSPSTSSSGGEMWVTSIDTFVEAVRERITVTLNARRAAGDQTELRVSTSWTSGMGVLLFGGGLDDAATPTRLDEELWTLTAQARAFRGRKQRFFLFFLVLTALVILAAVLTPAMVAERDRTLAWLLTAYGGALALSAGWLSLAALREQHDTKKEMDYLSDKIDLADFPQDKERRAYNLFKLNGRELQRYYGQAL
jgi:hypothetical protein